MALLVITCPHCPASPTTYPTMGELENHRLAAHERPLPLAVCAARLEAESHMIGRARQGPWEQDETHWHRLRIAGRNGHSETEG